MLLYLYLLSPFHCRGLSKPRRCHIILLQTQQNDVISKGKYMISKGNCSKYLKKLRNAVFVLNDMKLEVRRRNVGHIAEYKFSPNRHRDLSGSHVSCLNQWKSEISVRGKTIFLFKNSWKCDGHFTHDVIIALMKVLWDYYL